MFYLAHVMVMLFGIITLFTTPGINDYSHLSVRLCIVLMMGYSILAILYRAARSDPEIILGIANRDLARAAARSVIRGKKTRFDDIQATREKIIAEENKWEKLGRGIKS